MLWNFFSLDWFGAYPIATASSAVFYVFLLLLVFPAPRSFLAPYFVHPIPSHQTYLGGFDTFRGFAACFVAMGHCWWATYPLFAPTQLAAPFLAYAAKGVPIFAVLSGFLIYRSILNIGSLRDMRAYAIRRFFRIYPVYALCVLGCLALGQYIPGTNFSDIGYFVSDLFMFPIISWPGGYANPPTWSLHVEVTFYAFSPIAVLVFGRRRMLPLSMIAITAMIIADNPSRVFLLWRYFLFGIVASEISMHAKRWAPAAFVVGLGLFYIDMMGPRGDWVAWLGIGQQQNNHSTLGLGLACSLILLALPHLRRTATVLNFLPFKMIGVVSYSIYMVQFFYIIANFPVFSYFSNFGSQTMYHHFKALSSAPAWYLPLVFFPGVITWGTVLFLLVERPGIKLGARIVRKIRAQQNTPQQSQ